MITGGVTSFTVTVCVHEAVPELLLAVHVTVVTPSWNGAFCAPPSLRVLVTVTLSPVVVGVPRLTVALQLAPAFVVTAAGHEIVTGEPDDVTVTRNVQLAPPEDVTVTGVEPTGKKEPDAVLAVRVPQSPDDSADENVTCAPLVGTPSTFSTVSAVAVTFPGQVNEQLAGLLFPDVRLVPDVLLDSC